MATLYYGITPVGQAYVNVATVVKPLTQAEYKALVVKDSNTLYVLTDVETPSDSSISEHNTDSEAHADIRAAINDAGGVFVAEYGVTTAAEIKEAVTAGRDVVCKNEMYYASLVTNGTYFIVFVRPLEGSTAFYLLDTFSNAWSTATYKYETQGHATKHAADGTDPITPDMIGAAAPPTMKKIKLGVNDWDSGGGASVTVDGILADEKAQLITVAPAPGSMAAATAAGIYCESQYANSLYFMCLNGTPTVDVEMLVSFQSAEWVAAKIINFTVDGVTYDAEEGMTWVEWCASDYNTGGFSYSEISEEMRDSNGYMLSCETNGLMLNDVINDGDILYGWVP